MLKAVILKSKSDLMRNLFFIALIAVFMAGCSGKSTSTDNAAQSTTAVANKTVSLVIDGMTCTGCENTIQEAVTKIPGIVTIKASHLDSTAVVSFDSTQTSVAAIGEAITVAGYDFKGEKLPLAPVETK